MAEIENKWALENNESVDRAVQRRSAGKQGQRIEIALNRPPLLDHRPRKLKLDRPIKPNRIDCNRVEIATELRAGAKPSARTWRLEMNASTAAKFNAYTKPKTIRCGSLSERCTSSQRDGWGPLAGKLSEFRPPSPTSKKDLERATAPYDLGARAV